jgi:hypothetical protein
VTIDQGPHSPCEAYELVAPHVPPDYYEHASPDAGMMLTVIAPNILGAKSVWLMEPKLARNIACWLAPMEGVSVLLAPYDRGTDVLEAG